MDGSEETKLIGYHVTPIRKGVYGEISKIQEELDELKDAKLQDNTILQLVELGDLYGAIEEYALKLGVNMYDLSQFSKVTKRAFRNGERH